jgi:hypothetical protein
VNKTLTFCEILESVEVVLHLFVLLCPDSVNLLLVICCEIDLADSVTTISCAFDKRTPSYVVPRFPFDPGLWFELLQTSLFSFMSSFELSVEPILASVSFLCFFLDALSSYQTILNTIHIVTVAAYSFRFIYQSF